MTKRNPTPPGTYKTELGKELAGMTFADTIADIRPGKPEPKSVEDWLRADHQRNEYQRDVEQIKRCVDRLYLGLCVAIGLLVSMFALLLLLLWLSR